MDAPRSASSNQGRVIITHARSWQALAAIRSLGRRGIEVIAADEYSVTPGTLSRFVLDSFVYPSPSSEPDRFIDSLVEAARRLSPGDDRPFVLLPMYRETYLIARHKQRLSEHIAVPLADSDTMDNVRNKAWLARYARDLGVPVPRTWQPPDGSALAEAVEEMRMPVFVKLPTGASGVGLTRVEDPAHLRQAFEKLIDEHDLSGDHMPIVQEAVPGDDYCVTCLFNHGELGASLTYRNALTFPRSGGPGAIRETVDAPGLVAVAARLLGSLRWHGIAQVDFRWTGREEDEGHVIEVNPRFFGGLGQAIASGVDYAFLLYRLAFDGEVPAATTEVAVGTRTETPVLGLLATAVEVAERAGSEVDDEEMQRAFEAARRELETGDGWKAMQRVLSGLGQAVDLKGRVDAVRSLLEQNERNISQLFDAEDPLPVLGLVYPLSVFLTHGKLTDKLITGTDPS